MLSFILGLVLGGVSGFIGGLFYYARRIHQKLATKEVEREIINSIIGQEPPRGSFIEVNRVTNYVKEHEGEVIKLGDVIED